jgi:diacylglycerol kinase family enzyme
MYYYILDIKKFKKKSLVEDIKNYLSVLGISGEYSYPSAAYTTEDLVKLGISKKYNTIVAIGSDDLVNTIGGILCGRSEALGIIPVEASSDLCELIGAKSWKEAAENLRFRKIQEIRVGKTTNGKAFLTSINLGNSRPTDVTVEFKDFVIQAKVSDFMISNFNPEIKKLDPEFLDVVFQSISQRESGLLGKLGSFLGSKKSAGNELSLLRARSLRLFTSNQIPLLAGNDVVAKTPQLIESSDEKLRVIVGKKSSYTE